MKFPTTPVWNICKPRVLFPLFGQSSKKSDYIFCGNGKGLKRFLTITSGLDFLFEVAVSFNQTCQREILMTKEREKFVLSVFLERFSVPDRNRHDKGNVRSKF